MQNHGSSLTKKLKSESTHSWRWGASFEKDHVNRDNLAISPQTGLHQIKLRSPKTPDDLNTLHQILRGSVVVKLCTMPRCPCRLYHQPPRTPLRIKHLVVLIRRSKPCSPKQNISGQNSFINLDEKNQVFSQEKSPSSSTMPTFMSLRVSDSASFFAPS
ncbi:hypothetical protein TorRG33x02_352610 [Trema orientale]|uniref:Uncharacterized protein n=1 Tax=Trema orientale TaxID=63057 RepID=A0A2P5AE79_TREOI|nr:hypothetical protein TorRG33x02_352610 [Trema orientale]